MDAPFRPAQLCQGGDCGDAALKVLLAQLRDVGVDSDGRLVCTPSKLRLHRVWVQGYVVYRDVDVVDIDDGSAVMSFDTRIISHADPHVADRLVVGKYVSCVSILVPHPSGLVDFQVESVSDLSSKEHALAEVGWWLELAELYSGSAAAVAKPVPAQTH
mmetsp:Transcript_50886/g.114450  ORF Transcript_50886/g.114450 Transcript_50886/m.114450 type:complete len:159 (+) Transcript_50886:46-522(+)